MDTIRLENKKNTKMIAHRGLSGIETENGRVSGAVASRLRFRTPRILIATGGNGYPALGGRGSGFELVRRAEFDHYVMRNAEPIPAEIRYLRLVLKAPVPSQSWSNQIAGIEIER